MKENEKKVSFLVEESSQNNASNLLDEKQNNKERLKKPVIFGLMAVVFLGCMYLIFKPSSDKKEIEKIGLNDEVPEATGDGMPADKGKAYEQELLERKAREKRNTLTTLSDYWNTDEKGEPGEELTKEEETLSGGSGSTKHNNPALNSYRNAQSTLGTFYQDDNAETQELRKQLDELKEQLAEKEVPKAVTVDDQLADGKILSDGGKISSYRYKYWRSYTCQWFCSCFHTLYTERAFCGIHYCKKEQRISPLP